MYLDRRSPAFEERHRPSDGPIQSAQQLYPNWTSGKVIACLGRRLVNRRFWMPRKPEPSRAATLRSREMFVPLVHPAGEAQVDFGEALVVIVGLKQKAHYLAMDLPQSADCFVTAFPATR